MLTPSKLCWRNSVRAASRIAARLAGSLGRPGPALERGGGIGMRAILDCRVLYSYSAILPRRTAQDRPAMRSRIRSGRHLTLPAGVAGIVLAALLGGCGRADVAAQENPPVLVVQPGDGGSATTSLTGEIQAREESPLAFRIGGNMTERRVDVGDHVRRGDVLATLDPDDPQAQARAAQARLSALEAELGRV